ncbi:hypothetical protein OAU50_04735 [Planctomycetota bacterium]|nr:hypothetical protein [Planctomycetota bacterium]
MHDEGPLERLGKVLVANVRDKAIEKYENIVAGQLKSPPAVTLHDKLKRFSGSELEAVREAVVGAIDDVLHHLLFAAEEHDEDFAILARNAKDALVNVATVSDGLPGELYSEDGWISKYSRYAEGSS